MHWWSAHHFTYLSWSRSELSRMAHSPESCVLKHSERTLLPSRVSVALCRSRCLELRCTPHMVPWPFLVLIAAFTKWSLSYTINTYVIILIFLMGLGRNYFAWEPVTPSTVWACLSRELLGLSLYLNPPPAHLWDLVWAAKVPSVPTSKATFQQIKAHPAFLCGPHRVIASSFRCCHCLKKKKISVPKGN